MKGTSRLKALEHDFLEGSMSTEERPLLPSPASSPHHYESEFSSQLTESEGREKLERRLLRKLDIRMSMLLLMFIVNYIDRISAAAARLRGFEDDLKLEGAQFASILSIFYIGYITMQVPSNMVISQVKRPSLYLPICMIVWGTISFTTGFVTNYHGALAARFFLGISEAAFFPGALYMIARWYKRDELSQRIAYLSCGSSLSNAFGSLIASAVLNLLNDALGYSAWRWLFFIEGGLTVIIAIIATFILPDYPESEKIPWLTPSEHALAKVRILEDTAIRDTYQESLNQYNTESTKRAYNLTSTGLVLAVSDWKVWYLALAQFFAIASASHYLYFPTLAKTMGYNPTISLLLCAPPWLLTAAWSLGLSWHSDKKGERSMHIVTSYFIAVIGAILAMSTMNITARYISLFLVAQASAGFVCLMAWSTSTVSNPPEKRAVALALINAISQGGNIVGSFIWVKTWEPTYNKSFAICAMFGVIAIIMCLWLRAALKRMNQHMDYRDERDGEVVSGKRWRYHI